MAELVQMLTAIANFFADPLLTTFALLCTALFAGILKFARTSWLMLGLAALWIGAIVFTPLANILILPLEERFTRPSLPGRIDGIIILGGSISAVPTAGRGTLQFNQAADRFHEAFLLARKQLQAKLVYAGPGPEFLGQRIDTGKAAQEYFEALGIEKGRIITRSTSRNTFDDVLLAREAGKPKPDENWVVVTSAYHMPRAVGVFRRLGWDIVPWPVDYHTHGQASAHDFSVSPLSNLMTMKFALNEWLGLFGYWMLGRTDELFPAQKPPTPKP